MTTFLLQNGGLNHFIQVFIGEVHAVVRAQVLALGGNALTSFRMNKMVLLDSPHKNQVIVLHSLVSIWP